MLLGISLLIGAVAPLLLFPLFVRLPPGVVRVGDWRANLVVSNKELICVEEEQGEREGSVTKAGGVVVGVVEADEEVEVEEARSFPFSELLSEFRTFRRSRRESPSPDPDSFDFDLLFEELLLDSLLCFFFFFFFSTKIFIWLCFRN
jgi:hypothetical protein